MLTSFNYQRYIEKLEWNPIGIGQLERNDELGIDQRRTFGGGMARYLRDTNSNRIAFTGGLVRSLEEDAGSTDTTKDTEALIGMDLEWFKYDEPELDVSTTFTLFRRLSGSKEPRGNVDVNFRWEVFHDLFWGFSFYYTYDGQALSDEESVDYGSFTSLGGSSDAIVARRTLRSRAGSRCAIRCWTIGQLACPRRWATVPTTTNLGQPP